MSPNMRLEEFNNLLARHGLSNNTRLQKAIEIDKTYFKGIKRDDDSDALSQHLLPTTASLIEYYISERTKIDVDVLIGSLLHDVLEDVRDFDSSKIKETFGDKIFNMVNLLSKKKPPKRVRYHIYENRLKYNNEYYSQINSSRKEVKLIKAADRLNNLESAYSNPDRNKVWNYIKETEEIYLRIFLEFPYFYKRISEELARLREYLLKNR